MKQENSDKELPEAPADIVKEIDLKDAEIIKETKKLEDNKSEKKQEPLTQSAELPIKEPKPMSDSSLLIIIGVFIIIIILLFSMGKILPKPKVLTEEDLLKLNAEGKLKPDQGYMYKDGYSFVFSDGLWITQLDRKGMLTTLRLHFSPKDLENISIYGELNDSLFNDNENYYMTFDPIGSNPDEMKYVALSVGEFVIPYKRDFGKTSNASCIRNETEACIDRPIINCTNTDKPVMFFNDQEPTRIIFDNNCITIQGTGQDIVKATDRLMYSLYGIME